MIDAALDHAPVTFALYGHPLIFAYPPFLIVEMAQQLKLNMKILPAVSAMDCIFAELKVDPATNGMQMYEATELLLRQRPLQPDVPVLVWQIGSLETGLYSNEVSRPKRFGRFKAHLLKFYSPQHEVYAVCCSSHPLIPSTVYKFQVDQIDDYARFLHGGFTLYIPPAFISPP